MKADLTVHCGVYGICLQSIIAAGESCSTALNLKSFCTVFIRRFPVLCCSFIVSVGHV